MYLILLLIPTVISTDSRIIGGKLVPITEYPYQLSLRLRSSHICGAALLTSNKALSAAHCFPHSGPFSVQGGVANLTDQSGFVSHIERVMIHPSYNSDNKTHCDIAILFLATPFPLSDHIRTIPLPPIGSKTIPPPGTMGRVSGWGVTSLQSVDPYSIVLRAVEVPIWKWSDCKDAYQEEVTKTSFCAGFKKGGKDSCAGDSGGPFVVNGILYGVVSAGIDCAQPNFPGIYTNLVEMRGFIQEYGGI